MKRLPDAVSFARYLRKNPTTAEKFFWKKVRRKKLLGLRFQRQFIITHTKYDGYERHFIADFYCHDARLIIELDGKIHDNQKEYDEVRTAILEDMGYKVIRFNNREFFNDWKRVENILIKSIKNRMKHL